MLTGITAWSPAVCEFVAELRDALVLALHVLDQDLGVVDVVQVLVAVKRHLQLQSRRPHADLHAIAPHKGECLHPSSLQQSLLMWMARHPNSRRCE